MRFQCFFSRNRVWRGQYGGALSSDCPRRLGRGFTLIELMIIVSIVIIMSAVAIPSFQNVISSRRLQAVAWQMVQDLKTVREDAILYQQDLNVYINFDSAKSIDLNTVQPSNPVNKDNRSYMFETFQLDKDPTTQADQHYVPGDAVGSHFTERVLQYGIVITSIVSTGSSSILLNGKNYWALCFRCGSGRAFRGEADVLTGMTGRTNPALVPIPAPNNLVITLQDPATSRTRTFNVIVKGTGEVSMGGS